MNKDKIQLNGKQREYLLRLRDALKSEISVEELKVGNPSGTEQHLRDTVRFLSKIISNDWYYSQSAPSITMVSNDYNYLIKKHIL